MKMFKTKFLFAGKSIQIKTNDKKVSQLLEGYFPEFISRKKADLKLEYFFYAENFDLNFDIVKKEVKNFEKTSLDKKNNLIIFKSRKGKNKKMLVSGILDLNKNKGKMEFRMSRSFFWAFFVFNLAKCIGFYLNSKKSAIIHSSALILKNKGFLFPGRNESGKTTILRLFQGTGDLGEDMNFLFKKRKKFFIQGFPFIAMATNFNKKKAKPFELKAVFFLTKSKKLEIKKLEKSKAIAKMLNRDIQGMFKLHQIKAKERLLLYIDLFSCVPVFSLYFPLKKNLWKKLEPKLKKTVNLK